MSPLVPRQYRPDPSSGNKQAYMSSGVQQAMSQQMERALPAHLRKYADGNTYVPQHAQDAIQKHLEKAAPHHLKQYAGAYVQQNVVNPSLSGGTATPSAAPRPHPPVPDPRRLDHSNVPGEQHTVVFHNDLFAPDQPAGSPQPQPVPQQPAAPYVEQPAAPQYAYPAPPTQPDFPPGQAAPNHQPGDYDFIMSSEVTQKPPMKLPGSNSLFGRIGLVAGGLVVLLILFSIMKGILSSNPNTQPYVVVVADQQEIIQLISNAATQSNLSTNTQNFNATTLATVNSSKSALVSYLLAQKTKLTAKDINLRYSSALNTRLVTAAAATTYEATYHEIMKDQLATYGSDLQRAYGSTKAVNGRALLSSDYKQLQLLQNQLDTAINNSGG